MKQKSEERAWLGLASALLNRVNPHTHGSNFSIISRGISNLYKPTINNINGLLMDAIEELKLELELDGRTDIGSAYDAGDVYRFFADLKNIISKATQSIMIVDAYFNGEAFDNYLSGTNRNISIAVLANRHSQELLAYATKHQVQFSSSVSIRSSTKIHDRVLFIDDNECWIIGASIKDAARKPTYLIPLPSELTQAKFDIYHGIFSKAKQVI